MWQAITAGQSFTASDPLADDNPLEE